MTSHWLHGNSIFKIGCHYIWPGVIAFPRTPYLAIEFPLINHITGKKKQNKKVPITWDLFSGGTFLDSLCVSVSAFLFFIILTIERFAHHLEQPIIQPNMDQRSPPV
jgi:hypothetical protein